MSVKIKVMSFNMRVRSDKDGNNMFDFRREKILNMLNREKPDLIGFQEITDVMLVWLKSNLTDYYILGHGRNESYKGEGIPIAFRKDVFDLHAFSEEWLSLAPQTPKSVIKGLDQSVYPRVMSRAELVHKESTEPIAFFNMHTDHRGETARIVENAFLLRAIQASPFKFIATGDFNARPDAPSICMITATADTLGTVDATSHIKGSFHGFKGDVGDCKIDYIFTNLQTNPEDSYAVADDDSCGHYYSDHNAVCAFLEI